jgi:uncharacterized protein YcbK (DUF882 family)
VLALLTMLALAPGAVVTDGMAGGVADAPVEDVAADLAPRADFGFDLVAARGAHLAPGTARELSKKEIWLREKTLRPDFHTTDADLARALAPTAKVARVAKAVPRRARANALGTDPTLHAGERIEPVTTLFNVWTHEALPILPGQTQTNLSSRFCQFLRDHYTNQPTHMDTRLIAVLEHVAGKFDAKRIEVVSGYRSPKYNLMLRKKGHQVARHSQHMEGNAVDFRIRGVATRQVQHYVKSLHLGGVGFYPHSEFVHADTGPVRYWTGS